MTTELKISDTARYSVGQAAALLGVHRNTIARYTRSGQLKCGRRRANGRPFYLGSEIRRFWLATL